MKRYVIDSSSLMKFEDQFPQDILPSLWDEVYKLFEEGKAFSVRAVYEELEDLRKYVRETKANDDKNLAFIIASYRFRLIQLCREHLKAGFMTQMEYDQLTEFYKLYTSLGGNG